MAPHLRRSTPKCGDVGWSTGVCGCSPRPPVTVSAHNEKIRNDMAAQLRCVKREDVRAQSVTTPLRRLSLVGRGQVRLGSWVGWWGAAAGLVRGGGGEVAGRGRAPGLASFTRAREGLQPPTVRKSVAPSARSKRPRRGPRRVLRCARRPGEATRHRLFVFAAFPASLACARLPAHFMRAAVSIAGRCAVAGGVAELQGGQLRGRQLGRLLLPQRRAPGAGAGVVQHLRGVRDARGAAGEAGCGADGPRWFGMPCATSSTPETPPSCSRHLPSSP